MKLGGFCSVSSVRGKSTTRKKRKELKKKTEKKERIATGSVAIPMPSCMHVEYPFISSNPYTLMYERLRYGIYLLLAVLLFEDGRDTGPDELGRLGSIDGGPDTRLFVIVDNGTRLRVVRAQPLFEGLGVVVRSLNEGLASLVVGHGLLGRVDCRSQDASAVY